MSSIILIIMNFVDSLTIMHIILLQIKKIPKFISPKNCRKKKLETHTQTYQVCNNTEIEIEKHYTFPKLIRK